MGPWAVVVAEGLEIFWALEGGRMPWEDKTRYSGHYVWQEGRELILTGGRPDHGGVQGVYARWP